MKFSVLSITTIPDTASARFTHNTDGLNEESIAKMMFHERKQQTGESEVLRFDQRTIAAISLLHYTRTGVHIENMSLPSDSEEQMLKTLFERIVDEPTMVTWNGNRNVLPLLQYRAMMNELILPENWGEIWDGEEAHLDLCEWLAGPMLTETPTLDNLSKKLGYPGMMGLVEDEVWDKYLNTKRSVVGQYADLSAVNTFLVALRVFTASGDLRAGTASKNIESLSEILMARPESHLVEYARAWTKD